MNNMIAGHNSIGYSNKYSFMEGNNITMNRFTFSILLLMISVILISLILRVMYGYTSGDFLVYFAMDFTTGIEYVIVAFCVVVTIWSTIKRYRQMLFTLSWVSIFIISLMLNRIPLEPFEVIGSLIAVYKVDPNQLVNDTRSLAYKYPVNTCIGYPNQRYPCNDPVSRDQLPVSLQGLHVKNVLISKDYVLLEKFGMQGVFRGFVVFRKGFDLWKAENNVTLQKNCDFCWKIRIVDGLYWYHADPSNPPLFISPIN